MTFVASKFVMNQFDSKHVLGRNLKVFGFFLLELTLQTHSGLR